MQPAPKQHSTHVRHVVLALTVIAYMITYMDRVVISTAASDMRKELGISLVAIGTSLSMFRLSYALFQIPGGWLGDTIGPRKALTLIVSWWSIFTSLTALAWSSASLMVIRFIFGMGEAGAFPIATRSLSRWILPKERGFAQGVTHAGSRVGGVIAAPMVVFLIKHYGWRVSFYVFGAIGVLWALAWFVYYRDSPEQHSGVNAAELDKIHSASGGPGKPVGHLVPWGRILSHPVVWEISIMYVCYQYSLAWYTDWFPTYLKEARGFSMSAMGLFTSLSWVAAAIGNLSGGWATDLALILTKDVRRSRRMVGIIGFLIGAGGIYSATLTKVPQTCALLSCLAFFGLEMTVSVSWVIPLDIAGDYAGSAAAVMNMCGNLGGSLSTLMVPYMVKWWSWNMPLLVAAGLSIVGAAIYMKIDASRKIQFG
jgi:MFS transporter, ACS family, glucarate transporter